jgi:hypothetical protein
VIVRGSVLSSSGAPLAGARVTAQGSGSIEAMSDSAGRYTLTVPIGSANGVRRSPFRLEVRAAYRGRRLALTGGAASLAIEVEPVARTKRVRVRTNRAEATTALVGAFAHEGPATAWVEADFGGPPRARGSSNAITSEELDPDALAGSAPAARDSGVTPAVPATPAPATSAATRAATKAATTATTDTLARPVALPQRALKAASSRRVTAEPEGAQRANPRKRARRRAPPPAGADSIRVQPSDTLAAAPAAPVAPVVPARPAPGACACRISGTVEIDWDNPLERDFPVDVQLEGPTRARATVEMFIGSPREFAIDPIPCGEYRLFARAGGRLRYVFARGDTVMAVSCHGSTRVRVVLVPAKRP